MLVLSEEMPGPCTIDSVQLLCGSDVYNRGVFLNARVDACHTTVAELDSAFADNYAGNTPQAAMTRGSLRLSWQNGKWEGLGFDAPFDYNGADNLILEFRWQGDNDSSVYNLGYYTSGNRAMDAKSSTAERGTPRNYMPRLRIHYTAAGVGDRLFGTGPRVLSGVPNPFSSSVTVRLPDGVSDVAIYSAGGNLVRRLAGPAPELRWDGRDAAGRRVRPGAYFCRLDDGRAVRLVRVD